MHITSKNEMRNKRLKETERMRVIFTAVEKSSMRCAVTLKASSTYTYNESENETKQNDQPPIHSILYAAAAADAVAPVYYYNFLRFFSHLQTKIIKERAKEQDREK